MDEQQNVPFKQLLLRIFLRLALIVAVLLFLTLLLPPLLDLFLPFVLAFIAASILTPLVRKLTKKEGKVWNHLWSMLFVVVLLLAVTGIIIYAGYYLLSQISDLFQNWDVIQADITDTLAHLSRYLEDKVHLPSAELENYLVTMIQNILDWLVDKVSSWAPNVVIGVGNLASGIANFVVSLLFFIVGAYFMTADYPGLKKKLSGWVPNMIRPHMRHLKDAMGSAMFGYLRAQLILSGVVALISFVALSFSGQSYSSLIAIACGVIDLIPFFGSGTVLVPWAVIMLIVGNYKKALFLLILAFVLFLFRKLAEPKVVGNQTGLSPLVSLISIYVGLKLGGVLGMILCPIVCMIVIGLYGMGFFDPTIEDFRLMFGRILHAARLDTPDEETEMQVPEQDQES